MAALSAKGSRNTGLDADVIIVGAGLAGLTAAVRLIEAGKRVLVFEARSEVGGRIRSVRDPSTRAYRGDLGPTWVWPAYQPVVAQWLERLALPSVAQFETGLDVVEMARGQPPMRTQLPRQEGSVRIVGGPQALVEALAAQLPLECLYVNARVTNVVTASDHVQVALDGVTGSEGRTYRAEKLIVAVPPRVAVASILWQPALPHDVSAALAGMATWMAPHAKVVAFYDRAFWREQGLSGRIMSRVGPMVEVHDHCGPDGTPAALFGFVGWPRAVRAEIGGALADHVVAQLARCLGPAAAAPIDVQIQDWAGDPLVCSAADLDGDGGHPDVGPAIARSLHFDGKVCFAAAEVAALSPGLIEGALVAGEHGAKLVAPLPGGHE